ncbi:MAG: pilus assembly protein TadG-related protein [Chloroflexota bacterium]
MNSEVSPHPTRRNEKGQILIIVVFAIIGLVAFIGLVVDLGLVYISYGQLRRSVDAAALAASLQYREGYTINDLERSAIEFLVLNGINDPDALVETCAEDRFLCDTNGDGNITDNEHRKFVRVVASMQVQLAFLPVIGITEVPLQAEAVSEAASVDVVLAIDRSDSMTYSAAPKTDMRDPSQCNAADPSGMFPGECEPFEDVKVAAAAFVDNLFLDDDGDGPNIGYDRVGVVTFDRNIHCSTCSGGSDDGLSLALTTDEAEILHIVRHLWVFQAGDDGSPSASTAGIDGDSCEDWPGFPDYTSPTRGPCRKYDTDGTFLYMECPSAIVYNNFSSCTNTNIGGGLVAAGNEFAASFREESLWVVILLTDGAANSSTDLRAPSEPGYLPDGFCPQINDQPYCRDNEKHFAGGVPYYVNTRHCYDVPGIELDNHAMCMGVDAGDEDWDFAGISDNGTNYDADDFARDMADWLTLNNILSFSIGLGGLVDNATQGDPDDGEELLEYVAGVSDGLYFYAPSGNQLREIFAEIADNIATRLTR